MRYASATKREREREGDSVRRRSTAIDDYDDDTTQFFFL